MLATILQYSAIVLNILFSVHATILVKIHVPKNNASCGKLPEVGSKIVNGDPIDISRFPSAAQFFNFGSMCSGTVINSWSVLTAAHCFSNNKETSDMLIQVDLAVGVDQGKLLGPELFCLGNSIDFLKDGIGSWYLDENTLGRARYTYDKDSEALQVSEFVIHQNYSKEMPFSCDIAIIFLSTYIEFGPKVKKAVLAYNDKWMNKREKIFLVAGWGQTEYGGPLSDRGLMMTHLQFVPRKECGMLHHLNLTKDMFCLYGEGKRDSCKGDSGAGVLWKGMMVGIVSHGDGCSRKDKPSIYANVWYFRNWIESQVQGYVNKLCSKAGNISNKTIRAI